MTDPGDKAAEDKREIDTEGGFYNEGSAKAGNDLVGRDKIDKQMGVNQQSQTVQGVQYNAEHITINQHPTSKGDNSRTEFMLGGQQFKTTKEFKVFGFSACATTVTVMALAFFVLCTGPFLGQGISSNITHTATCSTNPLECKIDTVPDEHRFTPTPKATPGIISTFATPWGSSQKDPLSGLWIFFALLCYGGACFTLINVLYWSQQGRRFPWKLVLFEGLFTFVAFVIYGGLFYFIWI